MKKKEIYLILNNIRSIWNVGSIFRTADGAGVTKIYLCGFTPTPEIQPERIAKTALGAEKVVPWEHHKQVWRLLAKLKKEGIRIAALEIDKTSQNLFEYKPQFPLALLVGHERKGLSKKILEYVDDIVEIPMAGHKESLNVAVAAGIGVYQIGKNSS